MRELLEALRLADRCDEFPSKHSRGMRQKLALTLALGLDTELLMLDEPFDGLDRFAKPVLAESLQQRAQTGSGILITTHQTDPMSDFGADREIRRLELLEGQLVHDSAGHAS
jgi:ABC-2 type transport system ATP-binding protein